MMNKDTDVEKSVDLVATLPISISNDADEGGLVGSQRPLSPAGGLDDQTNLLPFRQLILVFVALSLALFCALLDQTIVATALPTIGKVFNRSDIASWVGTAYLLSSTVVQLLHGRMSDILGRKVELMGCLAVFFCGSLACSLSQTMIQLITFRALKGLGGGGIVTLVMIIVSDIVDLEKRGMYQGILGGVVALSNSIGPLLGGLLTEKLSWRWCFYLNLPLSALAMIIVFLLLPARPVSGSVRDKLRKMDFAGIALTPIWTLLLLVPMTLGGIRLPWTSPGVLAPMVCAVPVLLTFIWVESRVALPVMPLALFRNLTYTGTMISTVLTGVIFYACLYYLPQYFSVVLGVGSLRAGILLLPLVMSQTFFGLTSGFMVAKMGAYKSILTVGYGSWAIGLGLLCTIGRDTSTAKLAGYQILAGFGAGQTFQTSLVALQASVSRTDMAVSTSMRNFVRLLGGTVSLAACTAIINVSLSSSLQSSIDRDMLSRVLADPSNLSTLPLSEANAVIDRYVQAIRIIFFILTACACLSLLATSTLVKQHPLLRADDEAQRLAAQARLRTEARESPTP